MGGHEAEDEEPPPPLQLRHGPLRRRGEDAGAGQGTGGREDPTIHTPLIVLLLLLLPIPPGTEILLKLKQY
jgi:hypothetical protein